MWMSSLLVSVGAMAAAPGESATEPREQIMWIELEGDAPRGEEPGGRLEAQPEFLRTGSREVVFGSRTCGSAVPPRVLESLFEAMRARTYVRLETRAVERGGRTWSCLTTLRVFAPGP